MGLASAPRAQLPALENCCGVTKAPCPHGEPEGDVLTQEAHELSESAQQAAAGAVSCPQARLAFRSLSLCISSFAFPDGGPSSLDRLYSPAPLPRSLQSPEHSSRGEGLVSYH